MKHFSLFTVFFALISSASFVQSEDISDAVARYNDEKEVARTKIMRKYQELIVEQIKKGNTKGSSQLREFLNLFRQEDALYLAKGMRPVILEYFKDLKNAADELESQYVTAIEAATNNNQFELAEALAQSLSDQRIAKDFVSYRVATGNEFLTHGGFRLRANYPASDGEKFHSTFEEITGLAANNYISIRPINWPNRYMEHHGYRVIFTTIQNGPAYRKEATWVKMPGLANDKTGVSFRSFSHPDRYLRIRDNGEAWIDKMENTLKFRKQATFFTKPGLFEIRR